MRVSGQSPIEYAFHRRTSVTSSTPRARGPCAAAGRFGADVAQIGAMVQLVTRGVTLDTVTPDDSDDEIDIDDDGQIVGLS